MSMTELDKFILDSIENCSSNLMLGEEFRSLELSLLNEYFVSRDPIYEFLITLISKYQDDEELGMYLKKVQYKVESYLTN